MSDMSDEALLAATNGVFSTPAAALPPVPMPIPEPAPAPAIVDRPEPEKEIKFSWMQPHPIFVIVLVGPEEIPFGIQKDFLCSRSTHFNQYFKQNVVEDAVELVIKLPEATPEVFGLAQHFLYTCQVSEDAETVPSYESLIGVWKLGHKLGIDGLCDKTLEAMNECRRITQRIPATPLLVQVWRDTPEGSSIRVLLLSWAAEYMRSSESRADFAKSLPQEVLSELVVAMSSLESLPSALPSSPESAEPAPRKNVHYLEEDSDGEQTHLSKKSRRASAPLPASQNAKSSSATRAPPVRKAAAHAAFMTAPKPKPAPQKRRSVGPVPSGEISTERKVEFCSDLLDRMLSGPGFWTRLVGPFKEPVDPVEDGVPDYLEKVKKPMDLNTVKAKMSRHEYKTEEEFAADVRQIFENCYTYWKKGDPMWMACEKFQKTFEEKYAQMNKNITKMMREPAD